MCNIFGDKFFSHIRRHVYTMFNNIFMHSLWYVYTIFEVTFRLFLKTCLHNVWRDIFLFFRHDYTMFENIFTQCLKTLYNFVLNLSTLCFKVFLHFLWRHVYKKTKVVEFSQNFWTYIHVKLIKLFLWLKIHKSSK